MSHSMEQSYRSVSRASRGAQFCKVDVHVHTPASGDATWKSRYDFKVEGPVDDATLARAREIAEKFVSRAEALELRLVAITDHNSPSCLHPEDLTHSWYQLIAEAARGRDLAVLPGVEISTDDLHVLVILNPGDGPPSHSIHRIHFLLRESGFELDDFGDYKKTGGSSLYDILESVRRLDVDAIVIPAHIDGGNKALLKLYREPAGIYQKLMTHPLLNAVEVTEDEAELEHFIPSSGSKRRPIGEYFNSLRPPHRSRLAFIQNSDGHSLDKSGLGKRFTWVRMSRPDFWSLRNALETAESRIRLRHRYDPEEHRTAIVGMAFRKTGERWVTLPFNASLNCIIGPLVTNKSKLINLLIYGMSRFRDDEMDDDLELTQAGYEVQVFLSREKQVFCLHRKASDAAAKCFVLDDGSFKASDLPEGLELPRRYDHDRFRAIFDSIVERSLFLDWTLFACVPGMLEKLERRQELLEELRISGAAPAGAKARTLEEACEAVYEGRRELERGDQDLEPVVSGDPELGLLIPLPELGMAGGRSRFILHVKRGDRRGADVVGWIDELELRFLEGKRYVPIDAMPPGRRNACMLAVVLGAPVLGPVLLDEPERHVDVSALTHLLAPRLAELKLQRQIICVTKDEHVLLGGDADHVIVTKSPDSIEVLSGDVYDVDIQKEILELFEGDATGVSLYAKARKLEGILAKLERQ